MKYIAFLVLLVSMLFGVAHPVIAFDVDDTVLFSTPAFAGNINNGTFNWAAINTSDHKSLPIAQVMDIIKSHDPKYVHFITARTYTSGETLSAHLSALTGVRSTHVHFAQKKASLLRTLGVRTFYGDSDGDMADAIEAGATPIRVRRHPESSYKKNFNPGKYGEEVLPFIPTLLPISMVSPSPASPTSGQNGLFMAAVLPAVALTKRTKKYLPELYSMELANVVEVERVLLGYASLPFTSEAVIDRALRLAYDLRSAAGESWRARRWPESRLNMSRSQWAEYGAKCDRIARDAEKKAHAVHAECEAFVASLHPWIK